MADEGTREDRLAAMRQKFVARAREQGARIAELRPLITPSPDGNEPLQELMRLCHSLHGAAGSFGHGEISVAAGAAEDLCDALIAASPAADPAVLSDLDQAIGHVLDLIGKIG